MVEPNTTALLLLVTGVLLAASVLFSRASGRIGVPVVLIFLIIGVLAGEEGLLGIRFDNYEFAFRIGTAALVLILFDGGINTPRSSLQTGLRPALVLATFGVAGVAGAVARGARLLGLDWPHALLVGAIVSSTDAAAVFSMLRSTGLHLRRRVGATLELESGLNDPMAVILTMATTAALAAETGFTLRLLVDVVVQLAVGGGLGVLFGRVGRWVLGRVRVQATGLYPVLTVGLAFIAFGLATLLYGSGFMAVYVAAIVLGNGPLPYRTGLLRVHDAVAWLSQVSMFLLLGLLITPSELLNVAVPGLLLGLFIAFVGRPLVVAPILLLFRFTPKETAYMSWVGLRGAVPIILATFPVMARVSYAETVFNLIFFVVVVGAIVPGATVQRVTRWFGVEAPEPPPATAVLEITSTQQLQGDVLSFYVDAASAVANNTIADLPFPEGAAVMLLVRGSELVAARGPTRLMPGDHVYVFCRPEDRPFVHLMFGRSEES